jgi:hypothetical protein
MFCHSEGVSAIVSERNEGMFGPKMKKGAERRGHLMRRFINVCYLTSINVIKLKRVRSAGDILRIQMRRFVRIIGNLDHNINIYHRTVSCENLKCIVVD